MQALRGALGGERPDDIVRLVALHGHHGDVIGIQQLYDAPQPLVKNGLQLLSQLFSSGLVRGVHLVAEGGAGVMHPGEVLRAMLVLEALQEVHDAPCRRGVLAACGAQRPCEGSARG